MDSAKNTILVPVDFSDISRHALYHAVEVAKHFNNQLALLHIMEDGLFRGLLSFGKSDEKEKIEKEALSNLNELAQDIKKVHGVNASTHVREGKVYKMIAEAADALKCDSIIMGSNGASGMEKIIGSNASRVIMQTNVPVVVVKSAQTANSYKNIVFPLDLTMESRQKISWAIHLGKAYQSTIRILTYHTDDEQGNTRLTAALRQVENMLEDKGIKFTRHILNNLDASFAEETLKYAEAINADLILVMTHQEDLGLGEYLMGTEAQQIVNKSERIPVMCVKPRRTGISSEFAV